MEGYGIEGSSGPMFTHWVRGLEHHSAMEKMQITVLKIVTETKQRAVAGNWMAHGRFPMKE